MVQQLQVPFAGAHTFARASTGSLEALKPGQVAIIGVPLDSTAGLRSGTREAPAAIREASVGFVYPLQTAGALVDIASGRTLSWPGDLNLVDLGDLPVPLGDPDQTIRSLRHFSTQVVRRGAIPAILGGDRYITYPMFVGFADGMRQRNGRAGLIQLSGDLALGTGHPVGGDHWHGATLMRILNSESIDPHNVALVGVHGLQPYDEWERAKQLGIGLMPLKTMRRQGTVAAAKQALDIVGKGTQSIYVSIDITVVDAAYAPGRGTVTVGGMTAHELLEFVRELSRPEVGAVDVVGGVPALDIGNRMPWLAAQAVIELIAPRVFRPEA